MGNGNCCKPKEEDPSKVQATLQMDMIDEQEPVNKKVQELFENELKKQKKKQKKTKTLESQGTIKYNQGSTQQISNYDTRIKSKFLQQDYLYESSSDSDSDIQLPSQATNPLNHRDKKFQDLESQRKLQLQTQQSQPQIFTNFVSFAAIPSNQQIRPQFEQMQNQFKMEMQQIQKIKGQIK